MSASIDANHAKYALSVTLRAYDHQIPDEFGNGTILNVKDLPGNMKKSLQSMIEKDRVIYPAPKPSKGERENTSTMNQCIWVGMIPPTTATVALSKRKRKMNRNIRQSVSNDVIDVTDFQENALRVVVQLKNPRIINYYALVNPDENGICEGIIVPMNQVFFFACFRDDSLTSIGKRKKWWPQIIRDFMEEHRQLNKLKVKGHESQDKQEVIEAQDKLVRVFTEEAISKSFLDFAYIKPSAWSNELSAMLCKQLLDSAPYAVSITTITPNDITLIHYITHTAGLEIEIHHIRAYIILFATLMGLESELTSPSQDLAMFCYNTTSFMLSTNNN